MGSREERSDSGVQKTRQKSSSGLMEMFSLSVYRVYSFGTRINMWRTCSVNYQYDRIIKERKKDLDRYLPSDKDYVFVLEDTQWELWQ